MLKEDCWLGEEVYYSLGNALCSGLAWGMDSLFGGLWTAVLSSQLGKDSKSYGSS